MKPVIIDCPEVKPQSELARQKFSQRVVSETKVFRHHCHLAVAFPAGRCSKQLPRLVPHLVGSHPLAEEMIGDSLDRDLNLRYFRVIEGLRVASEGLLRGNVLKERRDTSGTLRLIFQRVSLLSLLSFRCLRIRS